MAGIMGMLLGNLVDYFFRLANDAIAAGKYGQTQNACTNFVDTTRDNNWLVFTIYIAKLISDNK
jgi:hypothetical protein